METESSPSVREVLGIVFATLSLIVLPVAWMFGRRFLLVSLLLAGAGILLFQTGRVRRREREAVKDGGSGEDLAGPPGML